MTCRHRPDDPECSSYEARVALAKELVAEDAQRKQKLVGPATPDSENFTIEDYAEIGAYMVLKVAYPNCASCAFEGNKVMVFEKVSVKELLKWRVIDPHFRAPDRGVRPAREAPSPVARFPASALGWGHALAFAKLLNENHGKRGPAIDDEENKTIRRKE